ncbi:peptide/nickel transport system ATP-binding protein/oligopeptide transport system ATP-binding protein [Jatrophihabitans sp. GAS493]|nr:peptide/nickel transport system ATP-binding protein/oligopeptide transport system ATP-binding protein [Jatrophihabitans sp. GAS493]
MTDLSPSDYREPEQAPITVTSETARPGKADPVLALQNLAISARRPDGTSVRIVEQVDLNLFQGERVAMVGESGSGKSATARAILRLDPELSVSGQILLRGRDLTGLSDRAMTKVRGREVAMVFQNPMGALDPLMTIGAQVAEPLRLAGAGRVEARRQAQELLSELGVPDASRRMRAYPHEFSGGMRQRVVLAMALAGNPSVLLADEPTTALDVRAQEQVLTVIDQVAQERRLAVLLITHDLATVAGFADRVVVMYAGRVVHADPVDAIFAEPAHPYTRGLLRALPRIDQPAARLPGIEGSAPHPADRPTGCVFHPRCPQRMARCESEVPRFIPTPSGGSVACHLFDPEPDAVAEVEARS